LEELYYIQDARGYVGNSVLWWAVDGAGYTCDLSKAWKLPKQKADSIARGRETDVAWPASVVEAAATTHVDMQRLRRASEG
jgi:predicted RecA/RadA family phage recombinase